MPNFCVKSDVEAQYGRVNINKWADLDNDKNIQTINNRVEWACGNATDYLIGRLIQRRYNLPFEVVPNRIKFLSALFSGILLYDGRLVRDNENRDELSRVRKEFLKGIREILNGQFILTNPVTGEVIPSDCDLAPDVVGVSCGCEESTNLTIDEVNLYYTGLSCQPYLNRRCSSCCCRSCVCKSLVHRFCG